MSDAQFPDDEPGIEIPDDIQVHIWDPEGGHRTCSQCGADCVPEPFEADTGFRIAFVCPTHGVHAVVDPFEDKR